MTHDLEGVRLHIGWKADLDCEVGRDVVIHLRKKLCEFFKSAVTV